MLKNGKLNTILKINHNLKREKCFGLQNPNRRTKEEVVKRVLKRARIKVRRRPPLLANLKSVSFLFPSSRRSQSSKIGVSRPFVSTLERIASKRNHLQDKGVPYSSLQSSGFSLSHRNISFDFHFSVRW